MTEPELTAALHYMGIERGSAGVLCLLPLIEVAWADGDVHAGERLIIEQVVDDEHHADACARRLIEDWLEFPPSEAYYRRGRALLIELVQRGESLPVPTPDIVNDRALAVAKAAGGLFGWGAVGAEERAVLESLAADLEDAGATPRSFDAFAADSLEDDVTDVRGIRRSEDGTPIIDFHGETAASAEGELVQCRPDGDRAFPVPAEGLTIGRARDNTVQIAHDGEVSRYHCRIVSVDGRWVIEDRSTNGTVVNGERVSERQLFGGEEIGIATVRFAFRIPT